MVPYYGATLPLARKVSFDFDWGRQPSKDTIEKAMSKLDGIPFDQQRAVFAGKLLENDHTFEDYNIPKDATIHMVLRPSWPFMPFPLHLRNLDDNGKDQCRYVWEVFENIQWYDDVKQSQVWMHLSPRDPGKIWDKSISRHESSWKNKKPCAALALFFAVDYWC